MSIKRENLNTIKWGNVVTGEKLAPVHPGEILLHDLIEPMELTRYKVAKFAGVPQHQIYEICSGKRAITANIALRLGRSFGISAQTWLNLQIQYDLEVAENKFGGKIDLEVLPIAA